MDGFTFETEPEFVELLPATNLEDPSINNVTDVFPITNSIDDNGVEVIDLNPSEEIVTDSNEYDSVIPDAIDVSGSYQLTQTEEAAAEQVEEPASAPALTGIEEPVTENIPETVPESTNSSDIVQYDQNKESSSDGSASKIESELVNIHKLLSERLPAETSTEEETELYQAETEVTLQDILNEITSVREYESEQLDVLQSINQNIVVSVCNNTVLGRNLLASVMILWGAMIAGYFFSKII